MIHKLAIKDLRLDAGTQQREVNDGVVRQYMEDSKGGAKFPAIDVMTDGKSNFVTDGFHRVFACRKLGKDYIMANITEGTKREAVWKSYHANIGHGFQREPGAKKEIVLKILADAEWGKISVADIARHVGVSHQFVSQEKQKMDEEPKEKKAGKKKDSGEKKKPEPVVDAKGKPVPEHLQDYFRRGDEIKQHITYLNQMVRDIKAAQAKNDLLWANLKLDSLKSDVGNLRRSLKFTLPYCVCPYCGGDVNNDECRACNGNGFVNELQWKACPADLKE